MDDYISRKAAINALMNDIEPFVIVEPGTTCVIGAGIKDSDVIKMLEALPSADVPHWIPCSEQMPPMDEYVLVCTVDGDITDGQRWDEDDDGTWFIFGDSHSASDGDIVAWMPLPEPYEEGETNEQ